MCDGDGDAGFGALVAGGKLVGKCCYQGVLVADLYDHYSVTMKKESARRGRIQ